MKKTYMSPDVGHGGRLVIVSFLGVCVESSLPVENMQNEKQVDDQLFEEVHDA